MNSNGEYQMILKLLKDFELIKIVITYKNKTPIKYNTCFFVNLWGVQPK
jgi:DNA-binding transcriptional regulator WhiA